MLRLLVLMSAWRLSIRERLAAGAAGLREDTRGAALVEYSVLIGLVTGLAIALIFGVGQFVTGAWNDLCTHLNGQGIAMTC
jgi:pilus assembly protein Flp/PilA